MKARLFVKCLLAHYHDPPFFFLTKRKGLKLLRIETFRVRLFRHLFPRILFSNLEAFSSYGPAVTGQTT